MTTSMDRDHGSEIFVIATMMYARLRRASSRVIDVLYLTENREYALHVIEIALMTQDSELIRMAGRLEGLIPRHEQNNTNKTVLRDVGQEEYRSEPTAEEIYKAQISHHYIGALR